MSPKQQEFAIQDAQRKEVLTRLQESERNPETLESFEEPDLEKMVRDVIRKNTRDRSD